MANTSITIPTLYGGVSRQAPTIRFPNQVQEADNVLLSVRDGATKRPGSEMQFAVADLVADADYKMHIIHRDENEQYLVFIGQGDVRVFDLDGNEFNVLISQMAQAYLIANSATPPQLRAVTIADSTILLNTTVETGWLEAPRFTTATEHKHYEHMRHHTHDENDYDRTLEAEGGYAPGYWKYDPGDGTFATITFDPVSGTYADYTNYSKDAWNPGGFKANFVRYTLAVTNATWNAKEFTITLADVFANYEWRSGDQIKMTGGTDVVAGWYEILSKENDSTIVVAETIGPAADQTDVDGTHIGIHAVITMAFWERDPKDMWEIGDAFMAELHKTKGLEDALVDWDFTDETAGYFVITCPWRGQNATMLATEAPDAGYDFTATGRPFSLVGGEYTITAGTGNPATDYLPPDDRWSRVPASGQPKALLDPAKMPVRMARDFPTIETYRNNIMADYPFAYWRLGEIIPGTGDGLTGNYYNNSDFTGFALTRIDTTVNFDWGTGSPDASIGANWFSVRWTGEVLPEFTETYTFKLFHDDGVRLWVNDVLVVDNPGEIIGTDHTTTGTIALTAATRYSIKLEYQEFTVSAKVKLYWSAASQAEQIIPQARLFSSEASGTDVLDEVGGNHGSYVDTPTLGATGAISGDSDTAVTFNGSSEYANVGTLGNFGSQLSNGITLEAWVNPTTTSPDAILGVRDLTGGTNQEIFFGIPSGGLLEFLITDNNDLTAWFRVTTPAVAASTWTHVAVTWHPESPNECKMYINGVARNIQRLSTVHTADFSFINFDIDCYVGGQNYNGVGMGVDYAWSGSLDEIALYSHVLPDNIVLQHYLFGTGDTSAFFRIDTIDWKGRFSGNQFTNPLISIIENEKPISDIGFHRNRFVLAGDENIVFSQAADYFNFFLEDADNIADADPIDIALPSASVTKVAIVDHIVPFDKALIVFTKAGQQFETNTPEAFTHNTASLTASTAYKTIPGVRAVPMGSNLYFPAVRESTTQLYEYFYSEEKAGHDAFDVSEHCAGYLPTDIQSIAASLNNNIVLLLAPDDNKLYIYHYYWDGEKKVQSAWAKYVFGEGERIVDMGVIENDCWMLIENADGFFVTSMALPGDAVAAAADTSTSEDFTTYSETDSGSRATVLAGSITIVDLDDEDQLELISDKGAGYFGWYFKHEFDFKLGAATGDGRIIAWAAANTDVPNAAGSEILMFEVIWNDSGIGDDGVRLLNRETWAKEVWPIANMAVNTDYYVTIERVSAGTLECRIYSDSTRTIRLTTLSVPVDAGLSYRYIQMATSQNQFSFASPTALDIVISNLEFFERAWPYLVHLDNRIELTGVYGAPTTTWTLPVEDTSVGIAVLGPSFGASAGTVLDLTRVNSTTLTATGDYSGGAAAIGRKFAMNLELSRPYRRGRDGAAILDMTLTLMKLLTNHTNTGQYTIRVAQSGRSIRDNEFTPRSGALIDEEGNNEPGAFIMGRANDTTVSIRDESSLPVIISSGEYVVDYQRRSR